MSRTSSTRLFGVGERGVQLGHVVVGEVEDVAVGHLVGAPLAALLQRDRGGGGHRLLRGAGKRAHEATGQRAGGLAVLVGDLAGGDGGHVALGLLDQAMSAGRQVVAHLGSPGHQGVEVDDVEVGPVARGEHATAVQPDRAGRVAGVLAHQVGQVQPAAVLVPAPQRQQRGGEGGVADRAEVAPPSPSPGTVWGWASISPASRLPSA